MKLGLRYLLKQKIANEKHGTLQKQAKALVVCKNFFENKKHDLLFFEQSAKYLNPENVLKKGYTLTMKEGKIIKDTSLLFPGDLMETVFAGGKILSQVKKREKRKNQNKP